MTLRHRKLSVRDFDPDRAEPNEAANAWKVVSLSEGDGPESCTFLKQLSAIEPQFRQAAIVGVLRLLEVAASGIQLANAYDKKRCHEIGHFLHDGSKHRLYRIRAGDTRLVFIYGPSREICLCAALVKKQDKFTNAEMIEFETAAKAHLEALRKAIPRTVNQEKSHGKHR
ncbi:MAG: hypothetical protein ING52_01945 [Burkholderiales bacterium]|jgi:hypothetical protein|nr:hypothetical protein [Burkholderiales bacterium]